MERFRSKLNFWKKVEKKEPASKEGAKKGTPTLTPAKTSRPQPSPQKESPAVPSPSPSPSVQPQGERRSEQLGHNYPAKPLPRPGGSAGAPPPQYGAKVRASMPASVAAQIASAPPSAGARGSVPNARQMSSSASVGAPKGTNLNGGVKTAPGSVANGLPQQQRPSGALPTAPGARSRASMPTAPGKGPQQRNQAARMSVQPAGSRGQLPQPPAAGQGKIPSVRGTQPPIRAQQRQQQQQRRGGRGPLPTPPPGAAPAVARGPLPAPPAASGARTGAAAPVIRAQVKAPQANAVKNAPASQRMSVQPKVIPAQVRLTGNKAQRQSMPNMNKQASSSSSLSSSRPPNKPQPAPPAKSSAGPPNKAQPAPPAKTQSSVSSVGSGGSGIKPIVIADVFQQGSSGGSGSSGSSMSRRERRKEAGDQNELLKDINSMAKAQPKKTAPAPTVEKSSSPPPKKAPTSPADDFFIPIAAMKVQQSQSVEEVEDRPPTPPPRSPDGDRSHRSQRTAAPKIPAREPAPGEKKQTGFMSRIKSVFGSAPVLPPTEERENSSSGSSDASAAAAGAVAGAAVAGAAVSKSSSKTSSQKKAASVSQLPPTSTSFDSPASAPESKASSKGKSKSNKSKNKTVSQRASQATNKLSSSMHGMISPRGKSSTPAVGPSYGLSEQQQKNMKPEKQEEILRQQLEEIDDKIQANSRTKEGVQKMAELSASNDPMFEAQLMDLNTMLSQLMEARSRIASQLEKTGAIAPRTPVLSARSSDSGRSRGTGTTGGAARKGTLTRAGSSMTNLRARFYRSVGSQIAQHPQQLDTSDGDVLTMVWRAPTGWWKMSLNGVEGYVHSQFCEAMPDDEGEKAVALQKARQPLSSPHAAAASPVAAASEPQAIQHPAPQPVVSAVQEKRKTVVPKAVVKTDDSSTQSSTQKRMTMPLPQAPKDNKSSNKSSNKSGSGSGGVQAAYAVTPKTSRASVAAQPSTQEQTPAPQPQKPSYPQAKVIFTFEKSTPTEIGIEAGLQVSIIEVAGEWSYILHEPTANAGYIPNSYLEKL